MVENGDRKHKKFYIYTINYLFNYYKKHITLNKVERAKRESEGEGECQGPCCVCTAILVLLCQ